MVTQLDALLPVADRSDLLPMVRENRLIPMGGSNRFGLPLSLWGDLIGRVIVMHLL